MASCIWNIAVALLAVIFLPGSKQDSHLPRDNGVEAIESKCNQTNCISVDFDTDTEDCCGGVVYLRVDRFGERLSDCCNWAVTATGVIGAMYSTETQDCCNFRTVIDKSTHRCCGNDGPYKLATHGCCDGEIYNKGRKICCNGGELHSVSEGDSCCGNVPYDSTMNTCCGGEVKPGIGECCGNDIYQPNTDLCCQIIEGSVVHTPNSHDFSSGAVQCCGTDNYRPADELCCNMVVYAKDSASLKCCDDITYNENTEICCQGNVFVRGVANGCCGPHPYNEDNEVCCGDEVIPFEGHGSCCGNEPYNKEISTCVTLYGLNGFIETYVPEIPGITRHHFGRNRTAYLSTEQFECGGNVHYYDEGATDCCGGAITYSSSQYLCCSSHMYTAVVEKDSLNDMCCGYQSFNPETEGCCHGDEVYDMSTHQCCPEGGVMGVQENCYEVPACSVRRGNDRICTTNNTFDEPRSVTYNSENAVCTSSGVIAIPPGLARCGDVIYRTSQELCCQDELFSKFVYGKERRCCETISNPKTFVPALETCFNGQIFPIPLDVSEICSGYVYDNRYEGCDVAGRIRRKEEILEKPDLCYNDQTGPFYFNKLHHSCCSGHLIAAGHTCCNVSSECCQPNRRQGYNTETHVCCGGHLVAKEEGYQCCGTQAYDSRDSSKLCCLDTKLYDSHNGNVWCEGETITGRLAENQIICRGNIYTGNSIECCGAEQYDLETEICCRDLKYRKTSDDSECCGSVDYDSSEDVLCCGGSLYLNPHQSDACCGNVTYDTIFETCCSTGGIQFVTSEAGQCCSNGEEFDSSLHTCCDGLIHNYIADGECCGNHVIRDAAKEFCCGGRLVRHHGDKMCCHGLLISLNEECSG